MSSYAIIWLFICFVCMCKTGMHVHQMLKWEIPYDYLHTTHDAPGSYTEERGITAIVHDFVNGTLNVFTEKNLLYFDLYNSAEPGKKPNYWLEMPSVNPLTPSHLVSTKPVVGFPSIEVKGQSTLQIDEYLYYWNTKDDDHSFNRYNIITREIERLEYDYPVKAACMAYSTTRKSIFMFGGIKNPTGSAQVLSNSLLEFKLGSLEWKVVLPPAITPTKVAYSGCAFDSNGENFFVFGGISDILSNIKVSTTNIWVFMTANNAWDAAGKYELADSAFDMYCQSFSVDDKIYCIGGKKFDGAGTESFLDTIYVLDPSTTMPTILPLWIKSDLHLPQLRSGARLFELKECLWVVGGYQAANPPKHQQSLTSMPAIGLGYESCELLTHPPKPCKIST